MALTETLPRETWFQAKRILESEHVNTTPLEGLESDSEVVTAVSVCSLEAYVIKHGAHRKALANRDRTTAWLTHYCNRTANPNPSSLNCNGSCRA